MGPRKISKSTGQSNVSKGGRPSTFVETHPELLTNYMEMKPMVYDNLNLPDENEITRMIRDFNGHLARKETSNYGVFFRQLLDMFNVMALDKLKADTRDLTNVVKCQEIVSIWEDCISNLSLSEDYNTLILAHFPDGQFPDKFHQYLDTIRSMEPSGTETLDSWILDKYKDFSRHSQQEKQKIYLGHIILARGAHAAAEIRNRMNPLWKVADIPSGKSLSDMLRAIRFHLFKVSQYKLAIEAMKKKLGGGG